MPGRAGSGRKIVSDLAADVGGRRREDASVSVAVVGLADWLGRGPLSAGRQELGDAVEA